MRFTLWVSSTGFQGRGIGLEGIGQIGTVEM